MMRSRLRIGFILVGVLIVIFVAIMRQPVSQVSQILPSSTHLPTATHETTITPASVVSIPSANPASPTSDPPNNLVPSSTSTPEWVDTLFDPQRFSYEPNFYEPELQTFLDSQPGPLKEVRFQIGNRSQSFAEVVISQSILYSLNPKILITLLEQQQQLLSTPEPSAEQLSWAMGFQRERRRQGLYGQFRWALIELRHAIRDYAVAPDSDSLPAFIFADESSHDAPRNISLPRYALSRVLAHTTTPDRLTTHLNRFLETYIRLFDDPRVPPAKWPPIADPFLVKPMEDVSRITSLFDHNTPFLQESGSILTFWGEDTPFLSYDGHTGWDYAMRPPDVVLSAADGQVIFSGNSDDGCRSVARAVIIDHNNGYRSLYWHLHSISVETGQVVTAGTPLGVAGETGCAYGPHLHFQLQYLGRDVDPYGWCGTTPDTWANNTAGQKSVWLWTDMPNPCGEPPPDMIIVDDTSPGFTRIGKWQSRSQGYDGQSLFLSTIQFHIERTPWELRPLVETPALAVWRPDLPQAGYYRVRAYIPYLLNGLDDSRAVRYRIHSQDGETTVEISSETNANWWADLGTYRFDPTAMPMVTISELAGDSGRGIWADAIAWQPVP